MFSKEYLRHYRENFNLAYPIVLGQLSHILISVADNAMVGNYNSESLAAASLSNSIYVTIMVFGIGFSLGITPLIATAHASKKIETCRKLLKHGAFLYPLVGAILMILVYLLSYKLHWFNDKLIIIQLAEPYLRIVSLTLIPVMLFQCFRQFLEGLSMTKLPMYINIGGLLLNVLLNYILIFGKFGFPEMGLNGAGYATLMTRILMTLALMVLFLMNPKTRYYLFNKQHLWDSGLFRRLRKLGTPIGSQMLLEAGAFGFAAILVGKVGVNELAGHQIAVNVGSVTFLITTGLSAAASIRTAGQLGLQDIHNLRLAGKSAVFMGGAFMIGCAIFIFGMKDIIPTWYVTDEPQVIEIASSLLILVATFQLSDGVQVVSMGALRGIEDVKVPTFIALVAYWLIGIPLGYVLCFKAGFGAEGIWIGLLLGLSVASVLLYVRFLRMANQVIFTPKSTKEIV